MNVTIINPSNATVIIDVNYFYNGIISLTDTGVY